MATTSNMTLNTLLNVSYGTFTRGADFQKALEQFVQRGIKEGSKKGAKEAEATWSKPYAAMIRAGLDRQASAFRKQALEKLRNEKELAKQERLLNQELKTTTDAARKKEISEERARIKNRLEQERKARQKLEDLSMRRAQERLKFIEDYEAKINKTRSEKMQEAGDNLQNAIQGAFNADSLDLSSITETLGKGLAGGLGNLAGMLGAAGGAGGGAFAALASAATTLAAVVGPLAALAGVMAMAYNQTKDMNKEILEASSAFDLGGVEAGKFKDSLQKIRLEVVDTAYDLRLSREETMAAAKALSEAGITFREFQQISRGAKNEFEGFQDVLRSSLSAAYGLGLEVSSVAEYYNKMSRDLGYNLDQIEGSFGLISEQAQLAGMRTKDFFGAINETTAGMALYNFRIGDTATLLTELVEILGEDLAKQKIALEGTFRGMGTQEKYKQVLLGGGKFTGAVKADMRAQAKEFANSLKETAGAEGLKKSGILGEGGAVDTKKLAGMSGKAFREALETSGLTDVQKRQLQTMRTLSQAEKGSMGVAAATGALSKRGELAAQMAQGSAMFGGRLLSELTGVERMMAEEVTGRSGEEYDVLARIQEQMTAEFEQMQRANDPKIMGKTFEEAVTEGLLTASEEDVNKIVNKKHFTEVERAAREQLKESRSISQTITNVIQQLLSRIALGIELLTSFMAPEGQETRAQETSKSIARQEELTKSIDALDTVISEKKFALEETTDATERAKIKEELDAAMKEKSSLRKSLQEEEEVQRGIARGKTAGQVRSDLLKGQYGDKLGSLTPEQLKSAGLGNLVKERGGGVYDTPGGSSGYVEEFVDLKEISTEEKDLLEKMFEREQAQEEYEKQEDINIKLRDMEAAKQSKEEHGELIKTLQTMSQAEAIQQMAGYLGLTAKQVELAVKGDEGTLAGIKALFEGGEGGFTEAERMLAAATGLSGLVGSVEAPANDFIYRGDGNRGTITPINKADEFYGAKPGGAIDQALQGSGGKAVNIYIQGGDEARVYSIVKKVLLETGYSGMKSY